MKASEYSPKTLGSSSDIDFDISNQLERTACSSSSKSEQILPVSKETASKTAKHSDLISQSPIVEQLKLQPMTKSDLDQVVAIDAKAHTFPYLRADFERVLQEKFVTRCAWLEDKIIAYTIGRPLKDFWHLCNIAVSPDKQRLGIGRFMLHDTRQLAKTHGLNLIQLEVRPSNSGALRLYRRLGFYNTGEWPDLYETENDQRENGLIMKLFFIK